VNLSENEGLVSKMNKVHNFFCICLHIASVSTAFWEMRLHTALELKQAPENMFNISYGIIHIGFNIAFVQMAWSDKVEKLFARTPACMKTWKVHSLTSI